MTRHPETTLRRGGRSPRRFPIAFAWTATAAAVLTMGGLTFLAAIPADSTQRRQPDPQVVRPDDDADTVADGGSNAGMARRHATAPAPEDDPAAVPAAFAPASLDLVGVAPVQLGWDSAAGLTHEEQEELEDQIEDCEDAVEDLLDDIHKAESKIAGLQSKIDSEQAKLDGYLGDQAEDQAELDGLQPELLAAEADVLAAEILLETSEADYAAKKDAEKALKTAVKEAKSAFKQAGKDVKSAEKIISKYTKTISKLQSKIDKLEDRRRDDQAELAEVEAEFQAVGGELVVAKVDLAVKENALAAAGQALLNAEDELDALLDQEVPDDPAAEKAHHDAVEAAHDLIDDLEDALDDAHDAWKAADKLVDNLTDDIEDLQDDIDDLLEDIDDYDQDIAELEAEKAEWVALGQDAVPALAAATAALAATEIALEQAEDDYDAAKDATSEAKTKSKDAKKDLKTAEKTLKSLDKQASKLVKSISKLQSKIDKSQDKVDDYSADVDEQLDEIADCEDQIAEHQETIAQNQALLAGGGDPGGGDPGGGDPGGGDPGGGDPGGGDPGGGDPGGEPGSGDPGGDPDPGGGGNPASTMEVPLLVHEVLPRNVSGFQRNGAVATFGMPIPEDWDLGEIDGRPALGVAGSSTWQARTLAHWPSGAVKWAQIDARVNVAAGATATGYVLQEGLGDSGQSDLASVSGNIITVNSGPLVAEIKKSGFNLFDRVVVDGTEVVARGTSPGIVGSLPAGGLIKPGPSTSVTIEENGPARCVIRADGTLQTDAGAPIVDFTCRITGRAGNRGLQVDFTVRNANVSRPAHVVVEGITLWIKARTGNNKVARLARHDGMAVLPLGSGDDAYLFQAYSDALVEGTDGSGTNYKPHIPKISNDELADEGYRILKNGSDVFSTGNQNLYPEHGFGALSGSTGGVIAAIRQMPYFWPAAVEVSEDGLLGAGVFTEHNQWPFTFIWRQHESRSVLFEFHEGAGPDPALVAKGFDFPVSARAADYDHYDRSHVFPYRLLTLAEQNQAYAMMGINHTVQINNEDLEVTRFLPAHQTGGDNNYASIDKRLVGEWLRHGHGGQLLQGLDLALYKSEWQIPRSDNFVDASSPSPSNDGIPHTSAVQGDDEHRYREGIVDAYYLTGDERYRDALFDEAEVLRTVSLWPHERSMYQTLRAMVTVAEFTGDTTLPTLLRARMQYFNTPTINVNTATEGWGWQSAPGTGSRRYFANATQNNSEKPEGEHFQARGWISASLGPLGEYHAARFFGNSDPDALIARKRMADLSFWTMHELYPSNPDPAQRKMAYSYAITLQQIMWLQNGMHPILLGMGESFLLTGDTSYLDEAVEQIEYYQAADTGGYPNDLYLIDSRPDCQHFFAIYRDWALGD